MQQVSRSNIPGNYPRAQELPQHPKALSPMAVQVLTVGTAFIACPLHELLGVYALLREKGMYTCSGECLHSCANRITCLQPNKIRGVDTLCESTKLCHCNTYVLQAPTLPSSMKTGLADRLLGFYAAVTCRHPTNAYCRRQGCSCHLFSPLYSVCV